MSLLDSFVNQLSNRLIESGNEVAATYSPLVSCADFEEPPAFFVDHPGQMAAWVSFARIIAIFAGWQSGKTLVGPAWLLREIKRCGPGDYALIAPNHPLLRKKALPELLRYLRSKLIEGVDFEERKAANEIHILAKGGLKIWGYEATACIFLVHADNPKAVEAFTAKAIWVDEAGTLSDEVWDSIQSRVAVNNGRILLTSRPYRKNWYVKKIWDRRNDNLALIEVVNFSSIQNPKFPKEEYYRQKKEMPPWKFRMMYDGIPDTPAGLVYDCIETVPRFAIPANWKRQVWLDFGNNNTAALKVAEEPVEGGLPNYYIYGEYKPGVRRSAGGDNGHVAHLKRGEPSTPLGIGGSHQEDGWRESWSSAGLPVKEPPNNVIAIQIAQTYTLWANGRLKAFDDLEEFSKEADDYTWPTDERGNVIKEDKPHDDTKFHLMACVRYGGCYNNPPKARRVVEMTMY